MDWLVPLSSIVLDEKEFSAAQRVLKSGWLSMGPEVQAFEKEFAESIGSRHAIATANATDALALCYDAVGVEGGESVAMCALTFVASLNVALRRGETPILVDIKSEDDLTMCVDDLAKKIDDNTHLIVTMPYGGYSPDMEGIMKLAQYHHIPVIEDSCHGILAEHHGQMIGTIGAAGVFSFYGNKNMTTGEGGMITTNDDAIAERARLMRSHGMTRSTLDHYKGGMSEYDVVVAGHNFRMDEIRAAIGREQLKKLRSMNEARRKNSLAIRERILAKLPEAKFPFSTHDQEASSHHLLVMILPKGVSRDQFAQQMEIHRVQTSIHYKPLHRFAHTSGLFPKKPELPVLESIEKRLVTLPLFPSMTQEQIEITANAVVASIQ